MANEYPTFNLRMLNLVIAMCRGERTVPSVLCNLGYKDHYIEFEFANSEGRMVKPEIIIFSDRVKHTIMWEWKSGGNIDADQMQRYADVTEADLRQRALVPPGASEQSDVAVVIPEEKEEDVARVLKELGIEFPVVAKHENGLSLSSNAFAVQQLNDSLRPLLEVDFAKQPLHYVPFDVESPDWVLAQRVAQQLLHYMHRQEPRLLVADMARDIVPAWRSISPAMQGRYTQRLKDIVINMARREFRHYLQRNKQLEAATHTQTWDIVNNPIDLATDKRTRVYKDLQRRAQMLVERLKGRQLTMHFPDAEE